jgi:hypothetical protein
MPTSTPSLELYSVSVLDTVPMSAFTGSMLTKVV